MLFAGASRGGYVFPDFLPAYDAVMSTCKVLELIARSGRSLSELAAGLPASTLTHQVVHCPWNRKGAVMRMLIEALKDMPTDHTDGIRVEDDGGWVQALPDPDDPVFHLYAEGRTVEESEALEAKYRLMLEGHRGPRRRRATNPQLELEESARQGYTGPQLRLIGQDAWTCYLTLQACRTTSFVS